MAKEGAKQMSDETTKENEKKIIKDPKVIYLIRTLSRTKRKDYENYVINAIWNKLANDDIEIVSQQYIFNKEENKRYFIDLFFPALNIGIECDEASHKENIEYDKIRTKNLTNSETLSKKSTIEPTVFDALYQANVSEMKTEYLEERIDVTMSYDEVKTRLEEVVGIIKKRYDELKPPKWEVLDADEYYKKRDKISIHDRVGFENIDAACHILFSAVYKKGRQDNCFSPKNADGIEVFKDTEEYRNHVVWFPHLEVIDEDGKPVAYKTHSWENRLEKNGEYIIEGNKEKKELEEPKDKHRIVFAYSVDRLRRREYKFIGVFEHIEIKDGKRYYKRVSDVCEYGKIRDKGK